MDRSMVEQTLFDEPCARGISVQSRPQDLQLDLPMGPLHHPLLHLGGPARARLVDPATSKIAALAVEQSGKAHGWRVKVLAYVREHPGETAGEIGRGMGLTSREIPSKRLPELRDKGWLENGEQRVCGVNGTAMMTWRARGNVILLPEDD